MSDNTIRRLLVATSAAFSGLLTSGTASGVEEPPYEVVASHDDFEVRQYGPRIEARTRISGDDGEASRDGFRILAGYIFGGNEEGEKVAMTAPVTRTEPSPGSWLMTFTMPAEYTMETLPPPKDPRVQLVEVPGELLAAIRFSGRASPEDMEEHRDQLLKGLAREGWEPVGEVRYAQYNPPWTPGGMRRNEVLIPVAPKGDEGLELPGGD